MFKSVNREKTSCYKYDAIDGNYVSFFIADSDYKTPKKIKDALIKRANHQVYGYTFIDDEYYEKIINWVKRQYGYDIKKFNIIPSSGIVNSLYYALLMLKDKSNSVVIQTPVYNQFPGLIKKAGFKKVENKLINNKGYFKMDLEGLEEIFKKGTRILILCSPHNPVGRVYSYEELEKLVLLCKKYDVYILSDEIHCDIILNGNKFTSLNKFYQMYEKIFVFFSPSKTFNIAGLKASQVIILNKEYNEKYRRIIEDNYFSLSNPFSIEAVKAAYTCDSWLEKQNKHLSHNYEIIKECFEKHPKAVLSKMEATYLAWIDLSYLGKTCETIYDELLERGMLISGGKKYGDECDSYIRLNFACGEEALREGLKIISAYLSEHE